MRIGSNEMRFYSAVQSKYIKVCLNTAHTSKHDIRWQTCLGWLPIYYNAFVLTGAMMKWNRDELKNRYLLMEGGSSAALRGVSKSSAGICVRAVKNNGTAIYSIVLHGLKTHFAKVLEQRCLNLVCSLYGCVRDSRHDRVQSADFHV